MVAGGGVNKKYGGPEGGVRVVCGGRGWCKKTNLGNGGGIVAVESLCADVEAKAQEPIVEQK